MWSPPFFYQLLLLTPHPPKNLKFLMFPQGGVHDQSSSSPSSPSSPYLWFGLLRFKESFPRSAVPPLGLWPFPPLQTENMSRLVSRSMQFWHNIMINTTSSPADSAVFVQQNHKRTVSEGRTDNKLDQSFFPHYVFSATFHNCSKDVEYKGCHQKWLIQ